MCSSRLELMTPESRGRRSNHFAVEDSRPMKSIFPIYRQSVSIVNFNTDKTGSRQSELFVCHLHSKNTRSSVEKNVETVKTS